jgi:pyridoxamine 5'-phosphate oxidase-like protein
MSMSLSILISARSERPCDDGRIVTSEEDPGMEAPRSAEQRKSDTLTRLTSEVDAWIATADADGNGYLLPLSFLWDGAAVIVSTPRSSATARNLNRGGRVRVGVGQLRDVTMIDGIAQPTEDDRTKDAFAAKNGWDPRSEAGDYTYYRIVPDRVQAWREVNELPGRTLMRDGDWLA